MSLKQRRSSSALHGVCEGEGASQASQKPCRIHIISEVERLQDLQ